ncbi:peptidase M16 [Sphingomonas metalli]|uniref:Peptidase M16 n=1 Tax=Sphingomonas metalli TaxID=1779358 RepID=A0A916SZQ9_9SPHN|nr:pitrilysin family protein [Sphingomonas metalli]GGB25463.1 peptidase M16 [Sphingomonas metalli]
MRARVVAALLAAVASPAFAATRAALDVPPATPVKPLAFTERTLANGLRVYAIRDTTTPNVSIQVWYDVGGRDDPRGRSGFAHLFEHLMFKATRNLVPEQMDRLTEDVGGFNNASTGDDYTNYYEVVPANHLQRLLFAEADRMASLVVEPKSFASERDVVKEEYRQGLARPYGKLFQTYLPAISYSRHPYARGVIGDVGNLDAATIEDVRAFHATYYRPDNAILVVAGNFDPAELNRWVDQYFAPIRRPAGTIPRVTVTEPPRTAPVRRTVREPNTPLPAVLMSWQLPPARDPDVPALQVLDAILATGEHSRLYESLVYRDQLATSAATALDLRAGTGVYAAYAIMAGGKSADAGETALMREVARLRDAPVTPEELSEAKNELVTAALRERETVDGKASVLASDVLLTGDPRASEAQLAAIQRVSAADVQRVARRYLAPAGAATLRYLPAAPGATGDRVAIAPTVVTRALTAPADIDTVTPASAAERIAPPPPGAAVAVATPRIDEQRLANGLRLVTVERHDLPLVTALIVGGGGAAGDAPGRAGTAALAASLLTKGTTTRTATDIARAVEALGGSIGSGADRDGSIVSIAVRSGELTRALPILADVVIHPAFAPAEIERLRTQTLDGVTVSLKDPPQLAGLVATRAVFGTAPYATPLEGTPRSLAAITRDDVLAAWRAAFSPDRSTLVLVGDIYPAAARSLAEASLGGWQRGTATPSAPLAPAAFSPPQTIVIDMPEAPQAAVVVARPGITRSDPRYYALSVGNTVLGGGFSSRLNQEIRIKRGLAYGASSSLQARRLPGSIAARTQTQNPTAAQAAGLILSEMRRMGAAAVPAAELETRKAVLIGGFGRTIETNDGMAGLLSEHLVEGVPLAEIGRYVANIEAVDPASVASVAKDLLDPGPASIVIVGDAKQFVEPLRAVAPRLRVIPEAGLDLDSPSLSGGGPDDRSSRTGSVR